MTVEPTDADFDDMHHALGRCSDPMEHFRNHYCTETGGDIARRFEALGWWYLSHTINDGRAAIYRVNEAGKEALAEWLKRQRSDAA